MTVVFVSNFFNHHQKPLCDAFYSILGSSYYFIETEPICEERLQMGWGGEEKPSYVKQSYLNNAHLSECKALIDNADVVIYGNADYTLLKQRLKNKKPTYVYTERIYKKDCSGHKLSKEFLLHYRYKKNKNAYLLAAGAFASADFAKTFTFINKAYKWGYFTETKKHNVDSVLNIKKKASILWVARFIDWKHPEIALEVARRLKADRYSFELDMIGTGVLFEKIKSLISENGLGDCVRLLGAMKPEEVRKNMEESEIFLFTSDRNEGWGAVLNESMNSVCAVVASHAIGSVPFLIENGKNGFIYRNGDIDDLYSKIKILLDNREKRKEISKNAYLTIVNEWNAENAARKFLGLVEALQSGEQNAFPYEEGVCSKAEPLKNDWM